MQQQQQQQQAQQDGANGGLPSSNYTDLMTMQLAQGGNPRGSGLGPQNPLAMPLGLYGQNPLLGGMQVSPGCSAVFTRNQGGQGDDAAAIWGLAVHLCAPLEPRDR